MKNIKNIAGILLIAAGTVFAQKYNITMKTAQFLQADQSKGTIAVQLLPAHKENPQKPLILNISLQTVYQSEENCRMIDLVGTSMVAVKCGPKNKGNVIKPVRLISGPFTAHEIEFYENRPENKCIIGEMVLHEGTPALKSRSSEIYKLDFSNIRTKWKSIPCTLDDFKRGALVFILYDNETKELFKLRLKAPKQ